MFKRIFTEILVLLLVVHVYISFAQQNVEVTVFKGEVESDLAGFNLYQDDSTVPFATIDSNIIPWVWSGEIILMNGKTDISATAFDIAGNESEHSPKTTLDPAGSG